MTFSKNKQNQNKTYLNYTFMSELQNEPFSISLDENKKKLKTILNDRSDITLEEFQINNNIRGLVVMISGISNPELVYKTMSSMMNSDTSSIKEMKTSVIPFSPTHESDNMGDFLLQILSGDMGILIENQKTGITIGISDADIRSISEPVNEATIRGPREGFIEDLRINTSMITRKIKNPHLKVKKYQIGRRTNTDLVLVYLDDIIDPNLVIEMDRRLNLIDIDGILDSNYIEEMIKDHTYSPFPQFKSTERPDTVAGALLEGKIACIIDGSPNVIIAPAVFMNFMQASEDYYEPFIMSTLVRWLRYVFLFFALTTPAFYIALTTFHQDVIPTSLLLSVVAAHEAIPFPSVIEALIMEITFEALREASVRLPKTIGQAISIIGALVVGEAAVSAGIVSAPMVIVVSLTGIASFMIPAYNASITIRILRFPFMFAAALFGFFGIYLCILVLLGHLAKLRSLGVPYLSPVAPLSFKDLKDTYIASPWPFMKNRPQYLTVQDEKRVGDQLTEIIKKQGGIKKKNE
ncbi:spore germination protein [Chengkuizengella sediminis]|uniref:spore germination protein n=1 Tax=Chengkuizengella sediminis TaxID=1885917 RepID=UPI001389B0F6|nr:spore germination protein [Chengkuizengella sediminis]NDI35817.1 spore germination protein [Chengkuizengella sediminis]